MRFPFCRNSFSHFMLRGTRRNVSTSLVLCTLKWHRAPFNGVNVDLSQLNDDCTKTFSSEIRGEDEEQHSLH